MPDKKDGPKNGKPTDPKALCAFHQFHDHYMEEWQTLRHAIQDLVDDHRLPEELKAGSARLTSADKGKGKENPELLRRLNSISGPFEKKSRKEAERME